LNTERKLVRDKIPELIARDGRLVKVARVSGKELCNLLIAKLREEVEELSGSPSVEEVADVLEVLEAIASKCLGVGWEEVLKVKEIKKAERGGFEEGLVAEFIRGEATTSRGASP